ncbi:MAG TPA: acetylornithine deacetylase [Telmatospirillum sp.]|nr:acetylornithine deacetylase [Telmatospirillum sp.]
MNASLTAVASLATRQLLETLVQFDTTSRNSNLELIDFVSGFLRKIGVRSDYSYDRDRRKANLFATIGEGPRPGLILSGHTDVVPVDGQSWSTDPFRLEERDGRFYGRGTCDMKGFIAVILGKAAAIQRAGLPTPIHLALSYDEEVGCLGVRPLIASLGERGLQVRGCIVGEPTSMSPVNGHKGKRGYRACVTGKSAHSSVLPLGVNAIEHAADLILHLRAMAETLEHAETDAAFDVPYTTLTTTLISGGIATNTIPADCGFSFEYRFLPDADPDKILADIRHYIATQIEPRMHRGDPATGIDLREIIAYPPLKDSPADLLAQVCRWSGGEPPRKTAFGTEAGLFAEAGYPSIVCGPGNIRQAHRPDEYVEIEQLVKCERFIDGLIADLSIEVPK